MGLHVTIYFKATDSFSLVDSLPADFSISAIEQGLFSVNETYGIDATHSVNQLERYYAEKHERGDWPAIASVLMILHATEGIEKVRYGGDDFTSEMTPKRVTELCLYYMENGHRPYINRREE
jgi:hypothetical protein